MKFESPDCLVFFLACFYYVQVRREIVRRSLALSFLYRFTSRENKS